MTIHFHYPPYRLAPVRLRRELEAHAGHSLTVLRTDVGSTVVHCLTCSDDLLELSAKEGER
jgi:hypothetical protein